MGCAHDSESARLQEGPQAWPSILVRAMTFALEPTLRFGADQIGEQKQGVAEAIFLGRVVRVDVNVLMGQVGGPEDARARALV
jgi:hypothetical protein